VTGGFPPCAMFQSGKLRSISTVMDVSTPVDIFLIRLLSCASTSAFTHCYYALFAAYRIEPRVPEMLGVSPNAFMYISLISIS
jgi:hypothetical protein